MKAGNKLRALGVALTTAIATLAAPQSAQAAYGDTGSLSMSNYAYPSALGFAITGHPSVGAGGFNASYDRDGDTAAKSFVAYCIDLAQTFNWNTPFTVTETKPISLFGGFKAGALDRLYTQRYAAATTPILSAAFQLAVWEIITETGATPNYAAFSLGGGSFTVSSGNNMARTTADAWLDNLGNGGTGGYKLTALVGPNNQDQMMATPVPEPETYMMLLAGLGLMGFVARRRQRNRSVLNLGN